MALPQRPFSLGYLFATLAVALAPTGAGASETRRVHVQRPQRTVLRCSDGVQPDYADPEPIGAIWRQVGHARRPHGVHIVRASGASVELLAMREMPPAFSPPARSAVPAEPMDRQWPGLPRVHRAVLAVPYAQRD